jgi:hypothetical protein
VGHPKAIRQLRELSVLGEKGSARESGSFVLDGYQVPKREDPDINISNPVFQWGRGHGDSNPEFFQLFTPPRHYFNSAKSAWRFLSGSRANPLATTPPFRIPGNTESGQRRPHDPILPIRAALPRSATFLLGAAGGILVRRPPRLQLGEQTGVRFSVRCF